MISHLGPQLGIADGIALANKLAEDKKATFVFTGDGGASEGDFHEAVNVASVWQLPVIFVIENNGYGLSTPTNEQYNCKNLADRGVGYGMMICYDWRFPESARSLKLAGADLVLHPSNLVAPTDLWWPVMSCRAFENRIFIATANRSGAETLDGETLSFSGGSRIVDVSGRILAEASPDEDGAIFSTIDPNRARRTMFNRFNDILDDRRPALYRYDAVESLDDDTLSTDPDGRDS